MPPKTYTVMWRKLSELEAQHESFDSIDKALSKAKLQIENESDHSMFGYEIRIVCQ